MNEYTCNLKSCTVDPANGVVRQNSLVCKAESAKEALEIFSAKINYPNSHLSVCFAVTDLRKL